MDIAFYKRCFLLGFVFLMAGCITSRQSMDAELGHFYAFKFGIRENGKNWKKPLFVNDTLAIIFTPNYNKIGIAVTNKFPRTIKIDWQNARFQENDILSPIITWGVDLANTKASIPMTEIAPAQEIHNGIIPLEMVEHAPSDSLADKNGYVIHQLYPDYDHKDDKESMEIMSLLGTDLFLLSIPVIVDGNRITYKFTFVPVEIERVKVSPWNR